MVKKWQLYILRCKDGTLYTGITDNFPRRLEAHEAGKGAKYTRGRGPFVLCYLEECANHSNALQREYAVKKLTRAEKIALCETFRQEDFADAVFFRHD